MASPAPTVKCPHCGEHLRGVELPRETNYDEAVHWACFNNNCPYYQEGWQWMSEQFEVKASYRYRIDPSSGKSIPLPVWSDDALRDMLVNKQGDA